MTSFAVAIDGPAGAGKSTLAKAAARALDMIYLDTGAMYRTCGLACRRAGLKPSAAEAIAELVSQSKIDIRFAGNEQHIYLNDEDVTALIRSPEISVWASDVSAIPAVRLAMVALQREIAAKRDIVVDGRDIGTYVLPEAQCKIFLTASPEVRAQRRYDELLAKGIEADYAEVLKDINYRDKQDSERAFAPLKQAEDAVLIDSTALNAEEVLAEVLRLARERRRLYEYA